MPVIIINSKDRLPNLEQHFKVLAGPGAGKTTFLVNCIRQILSESKRLSIMRKVACITYTNVATERILSRLGDNGGRLEISTIHSFLYKYLIKQYVHLIAADYDLSFEKLEGHDDIVMKSYSFFENWKRISTQQYIDHADAIAAWEKLRWKFDDAGNLTLVTPNPMRSGTYTIKSTSYLTYKKLMWAEGFMHHDDVLFFSYELVKKCPFVLEVLRSIFPYFLVDEFQDTSPIQIEILKKIALKETIVGIVGDEAQSIYNFTGAVQGQLSSFTLPGLAEYLIKDNWRSSNEIVKCLNQIRTGLTQVALRNSTNTPVTIFIGDKLKALEKTEINHPDTEIVSLSRNNLTANSLKNRTATAPTEDLLQKLKIADSNIDRRRCVTNSIKALEYAKQGYYKDALKTINKNFGYGKSLIGKKKALQALLTLVNKESIFEDGKLIDFYNLLVAENLVTGPKLSRGAGKIFYDQTLYSHVVLAVKNLYEAGNHRTIHKAKGEEFDCIVVAIDRDRHGRFNEIADLAFLLNPDLSGNEEHRVLYVAASRAKDHLYISVPTLTEGTKLALESMGLVTQVLV